LKNWRLERLDAVARAILRAGAVELEQRTDIPAPVVLNEYVEIAHSFFDGPEPGFINATLEACAADLRPAHQGA
jgi:N utilization substance protein B